MPRQVIDWFDLLFSHIAGNQHCSSWVRYDLTGAYGYKIVTNIRASNFTKTLKFSR
jgi:hypothetical protein